MNENNVYCLYNNKEQENLLAMAYNKDQLKEETQFYDKGIWFKYDLIDDKFLINEEIMKRIRFPKNPKKRKKI